MQRQLDHERALGEKSKPQLQKRSWRELLATWLVLLWGLVNTIIMGPTFLTPPASASGLMRAMGYCTLLHFACALVGGICALLRYRAMAYWLLQVAALALFVIGILHLATLREPEVAIDWSYLASLGMFATLFFFLAHGLGRREDIVE